METKLTGLATLSDTKFENLNVRKKLPIKLLIPETNEIFLTVRIYIVIIKSQILLDSYLIKTANRQYRRFRLPNRDCRQ